MSPVSAPFWHVAGTGTRLVHRMSLWSLLEREGTGARKRDWSILVNSNEVPQGISAHIDSLSAAGKASYKFKQKVAEWMICWQADLVILYLRHNEGF